MSVTTQSSNNLYCDVCKLKLATQAEYALHEFSKKHCDNLLRIAKNKPIICKQKSVKSEQQKPVSKEAPKVNVVTTQGNFAKYGYFIPGEVYETCTESKEFNAEYDPYLQKYAENPQKEIAPPPTVVRPAELPPQPPLINVTGFKKKKKRKIKDCEICNVTFLTVPEYDAHMKSPEHSWKLKVSGMGVSAHFVKANADLHTIVECNKDVSGDETTCEGTGEDDTNVEEKSESGQVFPTLYCDTCELLLNSEQQFNAHVNGKTHNENVQKKADLKARKCQTETPVPNQLFCFSCRVSLNNLYQYNEHKSGKKHKMKCRRLMKEGITIPPEERVASWGLPKVDPSKRVVYPEMYEKFLLENQRKDTADAAGDKTDCETVVQSGESSVTEKRTGVGSEPVEGDTPKTIVMKAEDGLTCNICHVTLPDQMQFDAHLISEDHVVKIIEMKESGTSDDDVLKILLRDRSVVKPDVTGRYTCTICTVTARNETEFRHHIASLVHEQSEEEYKKRRRVEVRHAVRPVDGKYACKSCGESCETLAGYNEHLHNSKHGEAGDMGKRKLPVTQQKRARKREMWRRKSGASKPSDGTPAEEFTTKRKVEEDEKTESKKPRGSESNPQIKPLMTVTPSIPPSLIQRRPPSLMDTWSPYPPAMANPFRGPNHGPQPLFPGNRYRGSPSFHPTWPRYPPCYP